MRQLLYIVILFLAGLGAIGLGTALPPNGAGALTGLGSAAVAAALVLIGIGLKDSSPRN